MDGRQQRVMRWEIMVDWRKRDEPQEVKHLDEETSRMLECRPFLISDPFINAQIHKIQRIAIHSDANNLSIQLFVDFIFARARMSAESEQEACQPCVSELVLELIQTSRVRPQLPLHARAECLPTKRSDEREVAISTG